jgi:hypothetical protein
MRFPTLVFYAGPGGQKLRIGFPPYTSLRSQLKISERVPTRNLNVRSGKHGRSTLLRSSPSGLRKSIVALYRLTLEQPPVNT